MPATVIDGKKIAAVLEAELTARVSALKEHGIIPCLEVILAGEDPASLTYVANKEKACARIGIRSIMTRLPADISQKELEAHIKSSASDKSIHGLLVQLPLPGHLDANAALDLIPPEKDVDGFHDLNIGRLTKGEEAIGACTPSGIMHILHISGCEIAGKHAVVIGRSNIVGKPIAMMLLNENATVTVCHSKTVDLAKYTRDADILIVSVGKAAFVTADMIKPGAVVIDVGINRVDGKLCGDVAFEEVSRVAGMITPVPGGVGRLTVAMLMMNTLTAAERMSVR